MSYLQCECGNPADGEMSIWNGKDYILVCDDCWNNPENIILQACVHFAYNYEEMSLERYLRDELAFHQIPWTRELQALCDRRYCEWYLEGAIA